MQDDQNADPRLADAPYRLRRWWRRIEERGFNSPAERELELDRIQMTTRLLAHLREAHGWSTDERVPSDEAWRALQLFDASHLVDRRKVDRRFAEWDKDGVGRSAVRDLAHRVLSHQI